MGYRKCLIIMTILLVVLAFLAIFMGKADIMSLEPTIAKTIVFKIRIPRIIAAISVGVALSISGTLFQSLLNNPLADSYTLGIASGSAFGACLAIYINVAMNLRIPIQILALVFGFLSIFLVIKISKLRNDFSAMSLVLGGIIIGSVFSAGLSFLKSIAGEDVEGMVSWLMGNLASKKIGLVVVVLLITIIGFIISYRYSTELNIITLGKEEAKSVGVNYEKVYKILIIVASALTSFAVSLSGIIGFVGLVVPHIARHLVGADNKKILPLAVLMGGFFLLSADTITRVLLVHELPVGILTTLVGGPFFIYICVHNKGVKVYD